MKKIIFSIAIITISLLGFNCKSQTNFLVGLEGTGQMSWLLNKDDLNNKSFEYINTFNNAFGISSQFGFTPQSAVGINVLYSMQGQKYRLEGVERHRHVDYLKIPVMFVYTSDINPTLLFIGKIGPQVGILMSAKLTDKDALILVSDQKSAYMMSDIGMVAYAGVGLRLGSDLILDASLKWDYGLSNAEDKNYKLHINNPDAITIGNGTSARTRAITNNMTAGLTVGLRYMIR